jgi:hypothetical protein
VIRFGEKRGRVGSAGGCSREKPETMPYFVYVLRSTVAERLYIGSSAEPEARLKSHNAGRVRSNQSVAAVGACFTCHVTPPAVENVVALDPISRIITRKNIQTALPLRRESVT